MLQAASSATSTPTLVITGGGTGGHVYPALAVAAELKARSRRSGGEPARLLYIGGKRGLERDIVTRYGLPFIAVASGAFRGRGVARVAWSGMAVIVGACQALRILRTYRVEGVLATGGYVSAPVVVAAWLARVPAMIYLPDVVPGLAVLHLSRLVRKVALTSEHSRRYFSEGKALVTGYPLREELRVARRQESRRQLGLRDEDRLILVLGGSRGARAINVAVMEMLPAVLERAVVIHASGNEDEAMLREVASSLEPRARARYRLSSYLHEDLAPSMAAADIAISRAGASVIGEYPFFGLPSILIPYPHAGGHQEFNADYLVSQGAAVKVRENELSDRGLLSTLEALLGDERQLGAMKQSASALSRPAAADTIAGELLRLCSTK